MALALTGCTLPAGTGAFSAGSPLEREAADMLLWTNRGRDLGFLARAYCITGSAQERAWMRETYLTIAAPAKVLILCPRGPRGTDEQ